MLKVLLALTTMVPGGCFVVRDGDPVPDVGPGDRLDITEVSEERCDWMGGTWFPTPGGYCANVDF